MRPNIRISHALNGRVKDYAAERGLSTDEAYKQIIKCGLDELEGQPATPPRRAQEAIPPKDGSDDGAAIETDTWPDETVLDGVYEDMEDTDARRAIGMRALDWLSSRDSHHSASDFKEALYSEERREGESEDTWWKKNARPALQAAVDAGLVEYRNGHHDYGWVDDE